MHYDEIKTMWETQGQDKELKFHKSGRGDWRWNERWVDAKNTLQTYFEFDFSKFKDGTLLDIGCGPRSMLEWWDGKDKYGIDPLANEYLKLNEQHGNRNSIDTLTKIFNCPAECVVVDLIGNIDFVWSHNALDHCYNWSEVLDVINIYLKPGATIYIGTDAGKPPNPNHPGIESTDLFIAKCNSLGWNIQKQVHRKITDSVWVRTIGIIATK